MRAAILALLFGSTLALAGCTMPGGTDDATRLEAGADQGATSGDATGGAAASPATPPSTSDGAPQPAASRPAEPAPPMSDPLPPEPLPAAGNPLSPDRSCRTSADCVVKNVGNCCGAMPACVNRGAATDPVAVKAQCERDGRSSICGFKDVQACECVQGTCQDAGEAVAQ